MAKKVEDKAKLQKGKFHFFNIVGKAKVNDNTLKLNTVSESGYKYNRLNLGVEIAPGSIIYSEAMGGYHTKKPNKINVNEKNDFGARFEIDFEDRNDERVLECLHENNFIKIGLETDKDGKTFIKKFVHMYDAIAYINEHLENDMIVNVKGDLVYSLYKDKVQVKKQITSIYLSKQEPENFRATFTQSILLDKDSIGKDRVKSDGEFDIFAKVIDYAKMYGDKEVKQNVPYSLNYVLPITPEKADSVKKFIDKCFKVKKDVTELIVEGYFLEGNQTGVITEDDIPEEMLDLIEMGIYTREEILGKLVIKGERVSKMIITKPFVRIDKSKDDKPVMLPYLFEGKYKESDLLLDFLFEKEDEDDGVAQFDVETKTDDDDNWLDNL